MRLKSWIFLVIILNLSVVLGANKISIELDKTVYPPFGELQGMCLLKLESPLDLGLQPKITLNIGNKKEERNALDVLSGLDPDLDIQESSVKLTNSAGQKTLDLSTKSYFGLKLPKGSEVTKIDFDVIGQDNGGFPISPYIDFKNDNKNEWYYAGIFDGWKNEFVNAKGLSETRASEDIIVRDNIFLYCSIVDLPYSNIFNVSADYIIESAAGNISMQIFSFDEETNTAIEKKGDCLLRNGAGEGSSSCILSTERYLGGDHLVCFYNSKTDGSYLLTLDDEGESSYECDSAILDGAAECSYLEEGDFFIRAYKPIFQGEFNGGAKFSAFGKDDFDLDLTDYLAECEEDEKGECDLILSVGSSNNKGKLKLANFKIEYIKEGGASFVTRRAHDVEYLSAKVLGAFGSNFNNYSLEIPLEVFDNLTVPNITSNSSTMSVKISLENLVDEESIEVNKNIISSAQTFVDNAGLKLETLKSKGELNDFYSVVGINLDAPINRLKDFKTSLEAVNSNSNLGISEKSTEVERINLQANEYVKTFPKEIALVDSVDYPRVYPETINSEILGSESEEIVLSRQDEVQVDSKIQVISIENFDGTTSEKTFIKRTLSGSLDYFIFEEIPKDVAQSAGSIKFNSGVSVVKDDPLVKWHFNGNGEIAYVVEGNILNKLDKLKTVVLPTTNSAEGAPTEEIEDGAACGDNVCTEILEDEVTCPEDCKVRYNINWPLVVVLIIILILGIIYFNFVMNKKSLKEIVVKRAKFISPTDEENLKTFISKALGKGVPRATVYKILLQKRWSKDQIDYVFKKVQPPESKFKFIFDLLKKK